MSFVIQVQITKKAAGSTEKEKKKGRKTSPEVEPPRKKYKPNKKRNNYQLQVELLF